MQKWFYRTMCTKSPSKTAELRDAVDCVLTFEELAAIFEAIN